MDEDSRAWHKGKEIDNHTYGVLNYVPRLIKLKVLLIATHQFYSYVSHSWSLAAAVTSSIVSFTWQVKIHNI